MATMNLFLITKQTFWVAVLGTGLMLVLQGLGEDVTLLLRYENTMAHTGEWWRLFSGHFIHLGWVHLMFNLAGLWVLTFIFHQGMSPIMLLVSTLLLAVGTSLGLLVYSPDVAWYVGLSGVLHGFVVMGALAGCRSTPWSSIALLFGVTAKLIWEQFFVDVNVLEATIGGKVIYDAHLYGAVTGIIIAIIYSVSLFFSSPEKSD